MSRIIVLEGPDLAGKSTLAEALKASAEANGTRAQIIHNGPPAYEGEDMLVRHMDQLINAAQFPGLTIFDRMHVGALVYGEVMRGRQDMTRDELAAFDVLLDRYGAARLFVSVPTWPTLQARMKDRAEDYVDEGQLRKVFLQYDTLLGPERSMLFGHTTNPIPGWTQVDVRTDTQQVVRSLT